MWTASCVGKVGEGSTNAMRSFVLGWPTGNFVATFSSQNRRTNGSLLQRYINIEKEEDYPKSKPLKIFTKDIGNSTYSNTITIRNWDTANEVTNTSWPKLWITGSERDDQLWVTLAKKRHHVHSLDMNVPMELKWAIFETLPSPHRDQRTPPDLPATKSPSSWNSCPGRCRASSPCSPASWWGHAAEWFRSEDI